MDKNGSVYVAGSTTGFGAGGSDALILKYAQSGTLQWSKTWGGAGDEGANRIAVGPDGYIYVTGGTSSFGAGWYDVFLLKLDVDGNVVWAQTWGGASFEQGYDINFDQTGNIYVAAESYSNGRCALILKFSPSGGAPIWTASWKGPATYDSGFPLTVDSNFDVILVGTSWDYSVSPNHNSIFVVKFSSNGDYQWSESWITPAPGQDEVGPAPSVATDANGNIYVGAQHSSDCQSGDFASCPFSAMLLSVDPAGNFQWARTWGGPGFDSAGGLCFDSGGHLLVSGVQDAYGTSPTMFASSFDTSGDLLSSAAWSGAQSFLDGTIPTIAVSSHGYAMVVGAVGGRGGRWGSFPASTSNLTNSFNSVPYAVGTPTGQVAALDNPTEAQTGSQSGGGAFAAFYYLSTGPFLSFPLLNKRPWSAAINSVFDHSHEHCSGKPDSIRVLRG